MNQKLTLPQNRTGLLLALGTILATGCNIPMVMQTTVPTFPWYQMEQKAEKITITNTYNVKAQSYRENKEVLFNNLISLASEKLKQELEKRTTATITVTPYQDTLQLSIDTLFAQSDASYGIFIKFFDASFDQTEVVVTKTETGKEREAFYDIVVSIRYEIRSDSQKPFDTVITVRRFHSSRMVLSGLLAAGPSIVSNEDDAREGVLTNVDLYLRNFFSGTESRSRFLYVKKEFEDVGIAVNQNDYPRAFEACEKLADAKDSQIASRAYYNCAVLLEKMEDYGKVKAYLRESLKIQHSTQASEMLKDYQFQKD
jgi:hypothetical protein